MLIFAAVTAGILFFYGAGHAVPARIHRSGKKNILRLLVAEGILSALALILVMNPDYFGCGSAVTSLVGITGGFFLWLLIGETGEKAGFISVVGPDSLTIILPAIALLVSIWPLLPRGLDLYLFNFMLIWVPHFLLVAPKTLWGPQSSPVKAVALLCYAAVPAVFVWFHGSDRTLASALMASLVLVSAGWTVYEALLMTGALRGRHGSGSPLSRGERGNLLIAGGAAAWIFLPFVYILMPEREPWYVSVFLFFHLAAIFPGLYLKFSGTRKGELSR